MQRQHFVPIVQSFYVVNGFAGFAKLCRKCGIVVGHSGLYAVNICIWTVFILPVSL